MSEVANKHPKGYNNIDDWVKTESPELKNTTKKVDFELEEESKYSDEDIVLENDDELDVSDDDDFEVFEDDDVSDDDATAEEAETFAEVLELTSFDALPAKNDNVFAVAKYDTVNTVEISKTAAAEAKRLVQRITNFIIEFGDVELSDIHKKYLKNVQDIEIQNLSDFLRMALVNNAMINNIIERVNATTAEDYAIIQSYTNLLNLQMKIRKEITQIYTAIPTRIKKMKAEVICNQDIEGAATDEELITEDSGITQFSSQKQLLKKLAMNISQKKPGQEPEQKPN